MTVRMRQEPFREHLDIATTTFKPVSHPTTRLNILWALLRGEYSGSELREAVAMKPTVVSQRLAKLPIAHRMSVRRKGSKVYNSAENEHVLRHSEHAFTQLIHGGGR